MPPKAAKRKAKVIASEDDNLWGAPNDQARKKTRVSATRIDEDNEDTGRKVIKQPSWADWQKKFNDKEKDDKRQFAGTFKQDIERKREDMLVLINQSTKSLDDAGKEHAELFRKACVDTEPGAESITKSKEPPKAAQDSQLFKTGEHLFKKYRELVTVHEQANSSPAVKLTTHTSERRTLWKADMEQAQKVVGYGAQYGEKIVQCALDMSGIDENKTQLLTPPKDSLSGPGQMALDIHQKSIETLVKGEPTWGELALEYLSKFVGITAVGDMGVERPE